MNLRNIVILAAVVGALSWYSERQSKPVRINATNPAHLEIDSLGEASFQCEGKTHCSQMVSCDEAMFYLAHCPGTEMDGDGDGIPCESQHCG